MNGYRGAAIALALLTTAPAVAGMHSPWPGELVLPTIPAADNQRYLQPAEFVYSLVWVTVTVDGRRVPAYALVPADLPDGSHLSKAQATTRFWRTRQHFGIFDTAAHAAQHARWIDEPLGANK